MDKSQKMMTLRLGHFKAQSQNKFDDCVIEGYHNLDIPLLWDFGFGNHKIHHKSGNVLFYDVNSTKLLLIRGILMFCTKIHDDMFFARVKLFIEILYTKYGNLFDTHPKQHKFYFEKMAHLTTFTSVLEILLLIVNVVYLVIYLTKYKNEKHRAMNEYLIISFISLVSIIIVSFLIHVLFAQYYLLVPIDFIFDISSIVLILTFLRRAYRWVYQYFNRNLDH